MEKKRLNQFFPASTAAPISPYVKSSVNICPSVLFIEWKKIPYPTWTWLENCSRKTPPLRAVSRWPTCQSSTMSRCSTRQFCPVTCSWTRQPSTMARPWTRLLPGMARLRRAPTLFWASSMLSLGPLLRGALWNAVEYLYSTYPSSYTVLHTSNIH